MKSVIAFYMWFTFMLTSNLYTYRLYPKILYIFVGYIMKKIQKAVSQRLLYQKGYFIGYHNHFKRFDLMVKFKSCVYFNEGRWKQSGPVSHSFAYYSFLPK